MYHLFNGITHWNSIAALTLVLAGLVATDSLNGWAKDSSSSSSTTSETTNEDASSDDKIGYPAVAKRPAYEARQPVQSKNLLQETNAESTDDTDDDSI